MRKQRVWLVLCAAAFIALVPWTAKAEWQQVDIASFSAGESHYTSLAIGSGGKISVMKFVIPDTDGDGIADNKDNCPAVANADQKTISAMASSSFSAASCRTATAGWCGPRRRKGCQLTAPLSLQPYRLVQLPDQQAGENFRIKEGGFMRHDIAAVRNF